MCVEESFVSNVKNGLNISCKCGDGGRMKAEDFQSVVDSEVISKLKK